MLESCVWQGDLPMELLCDGYQSIEQSKTYFGNLAPEYRDYSDREELLSWGASSTVARSHLRKVPACFENKANTGIS